MSWGKSAAVFYLLSGFAVASFAAPPAPQPHAVSGKAQPVSPPRPSATETPLRLFEKGFSDEKTYKKGACCDNICRLVSQLHEKKIDLAKARVIYILRQTKEEEGLYPQRARQGIAIWNFHVVLELDGKIYDFDYSDPTPVPAHDYFMQMFHFSATGKPPTKEEREALLKAISLRVIPAKEYLSDFRNTCDYEDYLKDTVRDRKYPAQSAHDFLATIPKPRRVD